MAVSWDNTAAKVKKIMGDKSKIPDVPSNAMKAMKDSDKAWDEFDKARTAAEDKLLAWQNSVSTLGNTIKQFADKMEVSDLGSDKSADDYKKKRGDAQKEMDKFFKEADEINEANIKNGRELDKHLRSLSGYKSPPSPVS